MKHTKTEHQRSIKNNISILLGLAFLILFLSGRSGDFPGV